MKNIYSWFLSFTVILFCSSVFSIESIDAENTIAKYILNNIEPANESEGKQLTQEQLRTVLVGKYVSVPTYYYFNSDGSMRVQYLPGHPNNSKIKEYIGKWLLKENTLHITLNGKSFECKVKNYSLYIDKVLVENRTRWDVEYTFGLSFIQNIPYGYGGIVKSFRKSEVGGK